MRRLESILLLLCCALASSTAFAWSAEGHRIIGHLAAAELTPGARAEVARLLAGEPDPTLAGVADWADKLRDTDETLSKKTWRWHFVNFKGGDCGYDPVRDCPGGECVVAAINRSFLALSDRRRPPAERRDALKFLVHFVGDAHQPLHASPRDDRGGNDYQVNYRGKGSNLHRVWDGTILQRRGLAAQAYADELRARPPLPHDATRSSDRPALDWAGESCRLVEQGGLYPAGHIIDDAFLDAQRPLAERRLREAGSRLAAMLNHALK